jgi:hypothetical protein
MMYLTGYRAVSDCGTGVGYHLITLRNVRSIGIFENMMYDIGLVLDGYDIYRILEGKQVGTLYHFTGPDRLHQILKDGHIKGRTKYDSKVKEIGCPLGISSLCKRPLSSGEAVLLTQSLYPKKQENISEPSSKKSPFNYHPLDTLIPSSYVC